MRFGWFRRGCQPGHYLQCMYFLFPTLCFGYYCLLYILFCFNLLVSLVMLKLFRRFFHAIVLVNCLCRYCIFSFLLFLVVVKKFCIFSLSAYCESMSWGAYELFSIFAIVLFMQNLSINWFNVSFDLLWSL